MVETAAFVVGKVLRIRRCFSGDTPLYGIGRIASCAGLLAVPQVRRKLAVMDIGRHGSNGMDQFRLAVDTDMRLHADVHSDEKPRIKGLIVLSSTS